MPRSFLVRSLASSPPAVRAEVFVKDPLVALRGGVGRIQVQLPGEPWLGPGPTSARFEVRDESEPLDPGETFHVFAAPVLPYARGGGFAVGRRGKHDDPRHHQVNVWAHSQRALALLEDARVLGRRVTWAFGKGRLILRPHAFEAENAYYDRDAGAIHFGYYDSEGLREPRRIHACLSHDVIVHELGHAILDGLKPLYYELDSPEVAGFHEYFGDALAMASSLTMREVIQDVVRDRSSELPLRNIVSELALEFGSGGRGHAPLRSAGNTRTMRDLRDEIEEHEYSEVLTGAYYDLLRELYADAVPRCAEELKKPLHDRQVVVAALVDAAQRTGRMMLRALDYCPPCGLTYREYARAVQRSDEVAYPVDERGYRRILSNIFRKRGVIRGARDLEPDRTLSNALFREYDVELVAASPNDAYAFIDANREGLGVPRDVNFEILQLYRTRKVSAARFFPPREVVLEYGWPSSLRPPKAVRTILGTDEVTYWCGGTLVFDLNGNVLHHGTTGASSGRAEGLLSYLERLADAGRLAGNYEVREVNGRPRVTKRARLRHTTRNPRH